MSKKKRVSNKTLKIIMIYLALILIYLILLSFDRQLYSTFAINAPENIRNIIFFIQNDWIMFPIIFLFGLCCIVFRKKSKNLKKKQAFAFVISVALSMLIALIFKTIINKPRPDFLLGHNSVPSGHATLLFTLFPFMKENHKTIKIIYIALTVLILMSRFVFGYHYLSDLFAGAVLGYSMSLLTKYFLIKIIK